MAQRGFNVGRFRASLDEKQVMRPNLFLANFLVPPGLLNTHLDTVRRLEFWVESLDHPALILNTYTGMRFGYGAPEFRPIVHTFMPCQFDIIFDANADNYHFFYDWMKLIVNNDARDGIFPGNNLNDDKQPFELSYRDDYLTDTSIDIFSPDGQVKNRLVLRESFPESIGIIRMAWSDNNSYMRLPITMQYTDWYVETSQEAINSALGS